MTSILLLSSLLFIIIVIIIIIIIIIILQLDWSGRPALTNIMERTLNQLSSHAPYVLTCLNHVLFAVWRSLLADLSNSDSFNTLIQKLRIMFGNSHVFVKNVLARRNYTKRKLKKKH